MKLLLKSILKKSKIRPTQYNVQIRLQITAPKKKVKEAITTDQSLLIKNKDDKIVELRAKINHLEEQLFAREVNKKSGKAIQVIAHVI